MKKFAIAGKVVSPLLHRPDDVLDTTEHKMPHC